MELLDKNNLISHKGLRPEGLAGPNSLESILENYKGNVEFDTILLRDGNIVIMHERDFGLSLKEVEKLSIDDIEKLKVTKKNGNKQSIPLFKEFFFLASDAGVRLFLEIKASSEKKAIELACKLGEQIAELDKSDNTEEIKSKINFQSFSIKALRTIKNSVKKEKHFTTGLFWPSDEEWAKKVPLFDFDELNKFEISKNVSWHEQGVLVAVENKLDLIEFQPFVITSELVKIVHDKGIKIGSSIIKDTAKIQSLKKMGVDYIKTE